MLRVPITRKVSPAPMVRLWTTKVTFAGVDAVRVGRPGGGNAYRPDQDRRCHAVGLRVDGDQLPAGGQVADVGDAEAAAVEVRGEEVAARAVAADPRAGLDLGLLRQGVTALSVVALAERRRTFRCSRCSRSWGSSTT